MKKFFFTLIVIVTGLSVFSQTKKIVVLGSSTAEGLAADNPDSCYVRRLSHYFKNELSLVDTVYNLGLRSTTQWEAMPTSNPMPAGFPAPNPVRNITKANQLLKGMSDPLDGVIIVNYPSNDVLNRSIGDIMMCFRTIRDSATVEGHRCFITTSQPREGYPYNTHEAKLRLAEMKDSILLEFGLFAIDFWTGMINPADSTILDEYYGDIYHFNNAGHRELFNRVVQSDIFGVNIPTPLVWGDFTTLVDNGRVRLQWSTLQEENTAYFVVEHSVNGKEYTALHTQPAKGNSATVTNYSFTHAQPYAGGYNFYRIKQVDADGKATWSIVRTVRFKDQKALTVRVSPNPVQNMMKVEVLENDILISIVDISGRVYKKMALSAGTHSLNVQQLPGGAYQVMIYRKNEWIGTERIIKQ